MTSQPLPIIIDDELVKIDDGVFANAVNITPCHDFDDFDFGQRHHVNGPRVISERGMMTSNCGLYAGMDRFEARKRVVEELQRKGLYE